MEERAVRVWEYEGGYLAYPQGGARLYRLRSASVGLLPSSPNEADVAALAAETIELDAFASLLPLWFFQDVPPPEAEQPT